MKNEEKSSLSSCRYYLSHESVQDHLQVHQALLSISIHLLVIKDDACKPSKPLSVQRKIHLHDNTES